MAGESVNSNLSNKDVPDEILNGFRSKSSFMKTWKPASIPSNRDRLELYSLHKQAVSGDAPAIVSSSSNNIDISSPAEKAKYNAWKSKIGLDSKEAMRRYVIECDRQIQMYGTVPITSTSSTSTSAPRNITTNHNNKENNLNNRNNSTNPNHAYQVATATAAATTLRGLAAIPLLCAAASEDRQAYIRRLQNTPSPTTTTTPSSMGSSTSSYSNNNMNNNRSDFASLSWWRRQEPLTATPGSIGAIPEHILLYIASFIEYLSLSVNALNQNNDITNTSIDSTSNDASSPPDDDGDDLLSNTNRNNNNNRNNGNGSIKNIFLMLMPPSAVIQSFFWPIHNCLLATWIEIILLHAIITGAFDCFLTVLWGSKNTGKTLNNVWNQHIRLATIQSIYTITDYHQPLSTRCVGLLLWPSHILVQTISIITIDDNINDVNPTMNINTAATAYPNNNNNNQLLLNANIWTCLLYTMAIIITWWYWIAVVPWITMITLILIFWVGGTCFALIELANV